MELLIKAAAISITVSILTLLLKKTSPEAAMLLLIAASCGVLFLAMELIGSLSDFIDLAAELSGLSPSVVAPVLKCVGIAVISRIASDLCKDAGALAIASSVELVGTAAALFVAMPLLQTLIRMIGDLI